MMPKGDPPSNPFPKRKGRDRRKREDSRQRVLEAASNEWLLTAVPSLVRPAVARRSAAVVFCSAP